MLVTFGIKPSGPETGYGYVKTHVKPGYGGVLKVERFVEKPDKETAIRLCAEGGYFWNAGIFLYGAKAFLDELERFEPDMVRQTQAAVENATKDLNFIRLAANFAQCRSVSIDYAVMEKTDKAALVPLDAGWSDVGTWDALFDAAKKDEAGNATRGDALMRNAKGCYMHAGQGGMVAVAGVDDIIVISTKDATLVAKRGESGTVKEVVQELAANGRDEADHHLTVHRPWGSYDTLHIGERFQVKRSIVEPGGILSLQMHHHRAEHWIVVKGTARITSRRGEASLGEPVGLHAARRDAPHRESGPHPAHLIEVQSGPYLGEDDIVRLEDVYSRI